MLESLVDGGWKYRHLEGHCLYDHSPSPQVQGGGVYRGGSVRRGEWSGDEVGASGMIQHTVAAYIHMLSCSSLSFTFSYSSHSPYPPYPLFPLYDPSPSPLPSPYSTQRCARLGGVWDDSVASEMSGAGGKCLTKEGAHKKVQAFPDAYDVVVLPLSSDGNLSGVGGGGYSVCRQCSYSVQRVSVHKR